VTVATLATLVDLADLVDVVAEIPSPTTGVWWIGPLPVRGYALCILARDRRGRLDRPAPPRRPRRHRPGKRWTSPHGRCLSASSAGGSTTSSRRRSPTSARVATPGTPFEIWEGGLGIWGAVALGCLGAWIGCRRHGVAFADFADAAAPGYLVAQAMGRLGQLVQQRDLRPADRSAVGSCRSTSGISRPGTPSWTRRAIPSSMVMFHPTFLYELLWCLSRRSAS
jgi:prolipoprotein diacylglyceryltransferase